MYSHVTSKRVSSIVQTMSDNMLIRHIFRMPLRFLPEVQAREQYTFLAPRLGCTVHLGRSGLKLRLRSERIHHRSL
jgi:hypothetical protein